MEKLLKKIYTLREVFFETKGDYREKLNKKQIELCENELTEIANTVMKIPEFCPICKNKNII